MDIAGLAAAALGRPARSLRRLGNGEDHVAFAADGMVIRVPLQAAGAPRLRVEARILSRLHTVVAVPRYSEIFDGRPHGAAGDVGVYPIVPGEALTPARFAQFTLRQRESFTDRLAELLSGLRALDPRAALAAGLHQLDPVSDLRDNLAELESSGTANAGLVALLHCLLAQEDTFSAPGVTHGDLSVEHLLVDANNQLVGVIDFGDMDVGDPDRDLTYLEDELGWENVSATAARVSPVPPHSLKLKLRAWNDVNAALGLR